MEQHGRYWNQRARGLSSKVLLGACLEFLIPFAVGVSVVCSVLILVSRRTGQPLDWMLPFLGVGLTIGAGIALIKAMRAGLMSRSGALTHLDVVLRTHTRLTCADRGVGPWPEPPEEYRDGLGWNWAHIVPPLLFALALVPASLLIPVTPPEAIADGPAQEPLAWKEMGSWVETLKEEKIVDQKALEEIEEKIEDLRSQPRESWYGHSSLEATDTLKQQLEESLQSLERNLEMAEQVVNAAATIDATDTVACAQLDGLMAAALEGLEAGMVPIDQELLNQLQNLDAAQMAQLTPEQLKALKECLKKGGEACNICLGKGEGEGEEALMLLLAGQQPGQGGIDRGPGAAPLTLNSTPSHVGSSQVEKSSSTDFSRASLGEKTAVGQGEHDIDETSYTGPAAAGDVGSAGQGGEAVWRNPLLPEERKVVQRYFK